MLLIANCLVSANSFLTCARIFLKSSLLRLSLFKFTAQAVELVNYLWSDFSQLYNLSSITVCFIYLYSSYLNLSYTPATFFHILIQCNFKIVITLCQNSYINHESNYRSFYIWYLDSCIRVFFCFVYLVFYIQVENNKQ